MSLRLFLPLAGILALLSAAAAAQPVLDIPVACQIGRDCFVQNYFDVDPSGDFKDFTCGSLGYNEHNGTDFRVPTMAELRKGVDVLAAADGVVARARDGAADTGRPPDLATLNGQLAGNAVVLAHGDGWETQYNHLRLGSQIVKPGDRVKAGQKLALMGFSGNTQFPHLDLEVRHNGKRIDPFVGETPDGWQCGGPRKPLWSKHAEPLLAYRPSGVLAVGFAGNGYTADKMNNGDYATPAVIDSRPLLFWASIYGVRPGDRIRMEIRGPAGTTVALDETTIDRVRALIYPVIPDRQAVAGRYRGSVNLVRDGRVIARGETSAEFRPTAK